MSVIETITGLLKVKKEEQKINQTETVAVEEIVCKINSADVNQNAEGQKIITGMQPVSDVVVMHEPEIRFIETSPVPGKTRYSASEKLLIVREGELEGTKTVCDRYGISSWTWKYWQKKRDTHITETDPTGMMGLEDKKSGSKIPVNKLPNDVEQAIQKECERCPGLGPSQIRNQLRRRGIVVSVKSVRRVMMEKNGYKSSAMKKEHEESPKRFEAQRPRQLVQMDILEFYIHKQKVYLLLALDDNSRFIMGWGLFTESNMENVMTVFKKMIEQYGKVESVLTDRAMVFYSWKGINQFQKMLEEYEIDQIVSSAHHPQTLGKVESVNKNIQKELISIVEFSGLSDAEEKIGKWIEQYNYRRTHQGIGGVLVPADRFFGRSQEVEEKINQQVQTGNTDLDTFYELELNSRSINIFQVVKVGEEINLYVLGRKVTLNSQG